MSTEFIFDGNINTKMTNKMMLMIKDYLYDDLHHYVNCLGNSIQYYLAKISGIKIYFSSEMYLYSDIVANPDDFDQYVVGIFIKNDDIFVFIDVVYDYLSKTKHLDNGSRFSYYDHDQYDPIALIIAAILSYRCYIWGVSLTPFLDHRCDRGD